MFLFVLVRMTSFIFSFFMQILSNRTPPQVSIRSFLLFKLKSKGCYGVVNVYRVCVGYLIGRLFYKLKGFGLVGYIYVYI